MADLRFLDPGSVSLKVRPPRSSPSTTRRTTERGGRWWPCGFSGSGCFLVGFGPHGRRFHACKWRVTVVSGGGYGCGWLRGVVYNVSLFNLAMCLLCVLVFGLIFVVVFARIALRVDQSYMSVFCYIYCLGVFLLFYFSFCYFCDFYGICPSGRSNPYLIIICMQHCNSLLHSFMSFALRYWGIWQTWFAIWRVRPHIHIGMFY